MCTKRQPFHEVSDVAVLFQILQGNKPQRPTEADCFGFPMSSELWNMANDCWASTPSDRPSMRDLLNRMHTRNDEP
jgi:hypothetical protein